MFEGSDESWRALVRLTLQGVLSTAIQRTDSFLDLLIHSLDGRRYSEAFHSREPVPLAALWQRRELGQYAALSWDHLSRTHPSDDITRSFDVIEAARSAAQHPASEWASELSPWTAVVECAREKWGDQWAIFRLANIASGIRSSKETGKGYQDLLDHSKPLCARARYARLRAGALTWWRRQVESVKSELEMLFLSLVLLRWGSAATISGMSEQMGPILQELSSSGWVQLSTALRQSLNWSYEPREEAYLPFGAFTLPPALKPRWATALGLRTKQSDRRQIYNNYLAEYAGSDHVILEFCQREGIDVRRLDNDEWQANLSMIRRSYAQGVVSEPFAIQHMLRRGVDPETLPLQVAEEVAANADKYPGYLVGLAETKCRSAAALSIIPVGKVADRDGWFEPDSRHS